MPQSITFSRNISQKELEIEEAKQMSWFNWLLERFNTIVDPPEKVSFITIGSFKSVDSVSFVIILTRTTTVFVYLIKLRNLIL